MHQDTLLTRYRSTSRRALLGSIVVLVALSSALIWNARRLEMLESDIAEREVEHARLANEKVRLNETLRSLKDAPDGGVRAVAMRVPDVSEEMYDFFLWVDVRDLTDKKVTQVRYEFEDNGYDAVTSTLEANGFLAFFRGPLRPGQPICPGRTQVTITFEQAPQKLIDYDLCAAVGLSRPRPPSG